MAVVSWVGSLDPLRLHISVITVAEIEYGIQRLPPSARRTSLQTWLDSTVQILGPRVLPVSRSIASAWGRIRAEAEAIRRTMPLADAALAATAEVHGLVLVTRNVRHFEAWGGDLIDPWNPA